MSKSMSEHRRLGSTPGISKSSPTISPHGTSLKIDNPSSILSGISLRVLYDLLRGLALIIFCCRLLVVFMSARGYFAR
jgi:hypothetical protein